MDYYALMGLRRGCSRSELERSYLLLTLRHKPDKSTNFIDRCEFSDEQDIDSVKERARMQSLLLYRLIQKGYTMLTRNLVEEEASDKHRKKASAAALQQAIKHDEQKQSSKCVNQVEKKNAFQGVFCRDLAVVGNLLSQTGFNRPIQVKYEGLSC
ncbi:putative DnaJ domain, Chaperone J-domain superfamily [Helianthus anomalus]